MKRSLLAASIALALSAGTAQAAFTPMADGNYRMVITGGCWAFGDCTNGTGVPSIGILTDNMAIEASLTTTVDNGALPAGTYGSGIVGDGLMGVIDFNLNGGNISVTSYAQDSYVNTPAGTIFLHDFTNGASMTGNIDNAGNMIFNPNGRLAVYSFFAASLGENAWNIDDSIAAPGGTGLYDLWITGTSTSRVPFDPTAIGFSLTGSVLQDAGAGTWTGTLVTAGNTGQAWGAFDGTPYSNVYDVQITPTQTPFFTPGASGTITVTSGCFTFGTCVVDGIGPDDITDNSITVSGIGSGIAGDGVVGVMNFTAGADGNSFSLNSFSVDTYTGTAGGDFATRMVDVSGAGGFVDSAGNMTLDVTGRTGIAQFFSATIGEQSWNLDSHETGQPFCSPGTGVYESFTTGASSAVDCFSGAIFINLMGSALAPTGNLNEWSGTLVSAGNVGSGWTIFDGTPYSEIYNVTVSQAVAEGCTATWGVSTISTIGKGQSPTNNAKVSMTFTGNIVDPASLGSNASRIPLCADSDVTVVVTDTTGTPTVTPGLPTAIGTSTEKFIIRSQDGKDTDRMTLLPR